MWKTPRGRISDEKGMRNAPTQSKGEKKKRSLNTEKKKKKKKKEPDKGSTQKKRALKCLSFDGLLGKLTALKNVLRQNENIDTHLVKNNSKWKYEARIYASNLRTLNKSARWETTHR
ncbi:hypothetical protein PIB30_070801, partial [Stylosanthes scabra]|nr:hypothetical protein [Stylosanthes scabra]